jgi:hypothetical protein
MTLDAYVEFSYAECHLCSVSLTTHYVACRYGVMLNVIYAECHKQPIMLRVIMVIVVIQCHYAECHYAERRYADVNALSVMAPLQRLLKL